MALTQPGWTGDQKTKKSGTGKRVYQVWKGSNRFFLCGRLIFGPDVRSLVVTVFLIVVPVVIFCVFVARKLLHKFTGNSGIAVLVAAVVFTSVVLLLLLLTSGRDPGIIPRNVHPPEPEEDFDAGNSPAEWGGGQTPRLRLPRTKDVIVNGVAVKTKYCETCMLYRPPRCSHCSICNNCVERFDHHCPWVGQCIGQRNYRFFFMFVSFTTLLCIYVFAMCGVYIKFLMREGHHRTVWKALAKSPASIILMAYSFISVWFVGGLTLFHLYLISTNQTTYENFRYRYDNKVNPYNRGILNNFQEIFCTAVPASKNKFRARVQQDSHVHNVGTPSAETGEIHSSSISKGLGDVEMGSKQSWQIGEHGIGSEHQEDLHARVSTGSELGFEAKDGFDENYRLDRNSAGDGETRHPRRSSWGRKSGSWEITPDIIALAQGGAGAEGSRVNGDSTPPGNR